MSGGLNDFLGEPGQAVAVEQPIVAEEPTGEPVTQDPAPAPEPPPEPTDEDDAPPASGDGRVPVAALAAVRKERQDYKTEAAMLRGERDALKAQLEAAQKAVVQPPAAVSPPPVETRPPRPVPNVVEDPEGYAAYEAEQRYIQKLEHSEMILRDRLGDEEVDAKLAIFKASPSFPELLAEANRQRHPWKWMYETAQRLTAMDEIGPDPNAYKAKVKADLRAEIEAEYAVKDPQVAPVAPRAPLPPASIGTARSAAPRNAIAWTGPPDFDEFLPNGRKK